MVRKRVEQIPPFAASFNRKRTDQSKAKTPFEKFERKINRLSNNAVVQTFSKFATYALAIFIFLQILAPVVVYVYPDIMRHLIFQHIVHIPFKNLSRPDDFGMSNTYAFKLEHDNVQLGAWHVLPDGNDLRPSNSIKTHFQLNSFQHKTSKLPIIILYLHGNTNDRSTGHRLSLYNLLRKMDYHVVAMDYRGYGDSTGEPTEDDVVKDALFTYEYLQEQIPNALIYIWGHSLGTGISTRVARLLTEKGNPSPGVVLEAPFFNIIEEVELHPITAYAWPYNPPLYYIMEKALRQLELQFRSDIHLTKIKSKVLILHAEDDMVIPIHQAEKLYAIASKNGISASVTFHRFSSELGCGHRNIHWAPEIPDLIRKHIV